MIKKLILSTLLATVLLAPSSQSYARTQTVIKENFKEIVLDSKKPVIVDVFAPWCPPCKHMMPLFEELANEFSEQYTFVKLNAEQSEELAEQYTVRSFPTLLFFRDGVLQGRHSGYLNKKQMMEKINEVFAQ
ncbi:MAG: thioredoxin [Candidatus Babeliales bacterium]